jgi:hypothetical protein
MCETVRWFLIPEAAGETGRRIGVWGSRTAFRHGYKDPEVSTELMMLYKRRHADTPTHRHADTFPEAGG